MMVRAGLQSWQPGEMRASPAFNRRLANVTLHDIIAISYSSHHSLKGRAT